MSRWQAFFSYSFRPFFLLGSIFSIVIVALWLAALHAPMGLPPMMLYWHGHEMLVGFAMAAVAGFVLTAVANWTKRPAIHGAPLMLLVASWLIGRVIMGFAFAFPPVLAAVADMLFPLLLLFLVGREIVSGGNNRNYPVVFIVGLMAALNLLYHLSRAEFAGFGLVQERMAIYLLLHLVLLLIAVIGGRIVPAFTGNWLRMKHGPEVKMPVSNIALDIVALVSMIAVGIADALMPLYPASVDWLLISAGLAAAAHLGRLLFWRGLATVSNPLLFVLHVAYLWFPLGYICYAASYSGFALPPSVALHALTMGVIGMMIYAVTTRVALGHTGRPLLASRSVVIAYGLMMLAVIVRIAGAFSTNYLSMVDTSGLLWMIAFGIFIYVYWPVLTTPRPD